MKTRRSIYLKALLLCCLLSPIILSGQVFSVTVNTTDDTDDGRCTTQHCSYREALNLANGFQGPMFILFNIGNGGNQRIEINANLPAISNFGQLTIDGSSQPGGTVTIDGNRFTDYGLELTSASNTVVDGLIYNDFQFAGVYIRQNSSDCVIGTTKNGNTFLNQQYGVLVEGARAVIRNNRFENNDINGVFVTGNGSATVGEEGNPNAGNTFIGHRFAGVEANANIDYVNIFANSFYCNEEEGITNFNSSNNNVQPPTITEASTTSVKGRASSGSLVQVYIYDPNQTVCKGVNSCQGNIYLGAVTTSRTGDWELNEQSFTTPLLDSYQVTATQTRTGFDDAGSSFPKHTSEFSTCFALCDVYTISLSNDGPACAGDKFTLTASAISSSNNPEPLTFNWTGPDGAQFVGNPIIADVLGTYTLIARNSCNEITESINVVASETPPSSIDATYNGPICEFELLQLFASTEKVIYEWSGPFGFTSNERNPVVNAGANAIRSGLYFLNTRTPQNGCPGPSDTVNVFIKRPPAVQDTFLYACVENITPNTTAIFDLTVADLHIAQGDSSVRIEWFEDETLQFPISVPESFRANARDVFAIALDSLDCQSEVVRVPLLFSPALEVALNITSVPTCNDPQGGSIQSIVTGGTEPFNYAWSDPSAQGPNPMNLASGLYELIVTDSNFCSSSIEINMPAPPTFQISCNVVNNVSRVGGNDGLATVSYPRNFNGPATIILSGPIVDTLAGDTALIDTIPDLIAGDYIVTIVDAGGCTDTCAFTITEPDCANFFVGVSSNNLTCSDSNDGSIDFKVSGAEPIFYDWDRDELDSLFSATNLAAGIYTTTITDNFGCSDTITTSLTAPPALQLDCDITQAITQTNGSDGQASINITGGTGPFQLTWSGPSTGNQAVTSNQTVVIDNLSAGTYIFLVTDENGCQERCTLTFTDVDCSGLQLTLTAQDISCFNANDGSISSQVTGAMGIITYAWNTNDNTSAIDNLLPGSYSLTIRDEAGCTRTESIRINSPDPLNVDCSATQGISRADATDGQVTIQVSGGTAPYTLVIPELNDTSITLLNEGSVTLSQLTVGDYEISIRDTNNCGESCAFTIEDIDCSNFSLVEVVRPVTCPNGDDGNITIRPQGGVAPFTYDWADNNFDGQASIDNLRAGSYSVMVSDNIGCSLNSTIEVGTQNTVPAVTIGSTTAICADACFNLDLLFSGQAPFNLAYRVIAAGFSTDLTFQSTADQANLEICAADFPANTTTIEVQFVQLSDATCTANLSQNRLINILEPARSQIDTILCSGQSITVNNQVYNEQRPSGQEVLLNAAQNGCDSIVDINLFYTTPPAVIDLSTDCDLENNTFQIQFDLLGLAPYTIEGANGNLFGNTFISEALTANGVYNLTIEDDFSCSSDLQVIAPNCERDANCSISAGTIRTTPANICQFDTLLVQSAGDSQLDSNSLLRYVVHDGGPTQLGNILLSDSVGRFTFQSPLQIGTTYHTAILVGRDNGFGVLDRSDPCLDIALGGPIQFESAPRRPLFIQGQDTLCVGQTLVLSTEQYPESGLSYNWITPLRDTLRTDSNSIQFPNIGTEAAGDYAVFISNGSCRSPIFTPHQFTTLDFPILYAGEDQTVCGLNQVELQADPISFGTGEWTNTAAALILEPNQDQSLARNLVPGVNLFIWTVSANDCISTDTVLITYLPTAVARDDQLALEPGLTRITFDPFVNDDVAGLVLDETTVQIVSQPELGEVIFLKDDLVFEYTAALGNLEAIAFEYAICSPACQTSCDTAMVIISLPDVLLEVPDGIVVGRSNDGLLIDNLDAFPDNDIIITNRWGVVVHRERNYSNNQPWKGTHNGAELPQGTYYMYLKVDGRKDAVKKTLHLIVR